MFTQAFLNRICRILRAVLVGFGVFFLILLTFSFTTLPFWGYYWLGTSESKMAETPDYIVLLGGGGMPGESNLMRAWFVCRAAAEFPESKVIISIPGDTTDQNSTARLVAGEMAEKGVEQSRILYEEIGTNTRSQALQLQRFHSLDLQNKSILLVTSPEHMRRAVLTFRKAGFQRISAFPAFENALEASLSFKDEDLGGNKMLLPDIGNHTEIRYQFWNHLKYEILIAREMTALFYYKLRGWI